MPPIYKNVSSKDDSILCSGVSVEWVGDNGEISVEYYATCSPYWCRLHSCRYLFSGFWCFPSAWSCKLCTYYLKDSVPVEPRESLNGFSWHFRSTSLSSVDPSVRLSVSEPYIGGMVGMAGVSFLLFFVYDHMTPVSRSLYVLSPEDTHSHVDAGVPCDCSPCATRDRKGSRSTSADSVFCYYKQTSYYNTECVLL